MKKTKKRKPREWWKEDFLVGCHHARKKSKKAAKRKVVQICCTEDWLFALCTDETIWTIWTKPQPDSPYDIDWRKIRGVPDSKEEVNE